MNYYDRFTSFPREDDKSEVKLLADCCRELGRAGLTAEQLNERIHG